jgi:hypothetical protein
MLNRKTLSLAVASLAIPAGLLGLGATGASAAPLQAQADPVACTTGSSNGNVTTCEIWSNSGQIVHFIDGTAVLHNAPRTLKICIDGPLGTIKCNPRGFTPLSHGEHIAVDWSPNRSQFAGDYCVNTWRLNSNHSVTRIGDVCVFIP